MPRRDLSKTSPSSRPAPPVGELSLIEGIKERALGGARRNRRDLRLGIGDDCAILRPRTGEEILVTTDFSLERRHFRRDWHSPGAIGHRALARGLSDLASMGARPVAAFLSLALPRAVAADKIWMNAFLDGLFRLADRVGVPLAGGDTSQSPAGILADIILLGGVPAGKALRRDGVLPGDRLFCSGALGGAAAELRSLTKRARAAPLAAPAATSSGHANPHPHLYPEPRLAVGQTLLRRGLAAAAIDISDGLSTDLRHLCAASGVAAEVDAARLPLHSLATALGPRAAIERALHGGEDYELLFTVRPRTKVPARLAGVPLTEIGRCVAPRRGQPTVVLLAADGKRSALPPGGWEHLR